MLTRTRDAARAQPYLTVLLLVAVSSMLWFALHILTASIETLLHDHLVDDAFYYFVIAKHFPSPEFDAGIRTTGFHPLYWLLIASPFRLLSDTAAVKVSLTLLGLTQIASGFLLYALVRRSFSPFVASLTAVVFITNPYLRMLTLVGLETPLAVMLVLLLVYAVGAPGAPTLRRSLGIGALWGLAFLARTDSVLLSGVVVLGYLGRAYLRVPERRAWLGHVAGTGVVALVIAAPWLAYTAANGSLLGQDSARALRILRGLHGAAPDWRSLPTMLRVMARETTEVLAQGAHLPSLGLHTHAERAFVLVLGMLFVALALSYAASVRGSMVRRRYLVGHLPLIGGVAVLFGAYGLVLGGARAWYLLYWDAAWLLVVLPSIVAWIAGHVPSSWRLVGGGAVGVVVVCCAALPLLAPLPRPAPQELDKFQAAQIARSLVEPDAALGSFNTGIYQFYMPQEVINLDGVMNPRVQPALRSRELCAYLRDAGVRYIIDDVGVDANLQRYAPGLTIVSRTDLTARYAHGGPPVADRQVLLTIDTTGCATAD